MFTASTDKTLGIWDYETGARIKKLKGHSSFINSCYPSRRGPQYVVSGADDCTVKVCFIIVSLLILLVETRRKSSKAMILLGVLKFKQSNLKLKIVLFFKICTQLLCHEGACQVLYLWLFFCLLEINHFHKNAIKIHKKFLEVFNTQYSSLNSRSPILYSFELIEDQVSSWDCQLSLEQYWVNYELHLES